MSATEDTKPAAGGDAKPPAAKTQAAAAATTNSSAANAANLPKVGIQLSSIQELLSLNLLLDDLILL